MIVLFEKYHGAGNDFIIVDCREMDESYFSTDRVNFLCDRHFGIGADGLILLLSDASSDFRMKYFNSDGREGTMCGNGGRCIVAFASGKGLIKEKTVFTGIDGIHEAVLNNNGTVSLKMIDVTGVILLEDGYLLDTGSKHFVTRRDNLERINVLEEGRNLRNQARFGDEGANINFIRIGKPNELSMRTYERGVENETLACGTGAVASAISAFIMTAPDKTSFILKAPGGELTVSFRPGKDGSFSDIWLEGPVKYVFRGEIKI